MAKQRSVTAGSADKSGEAPAEDVSTKGELIIRSYTPHQFNLVWGGGTVILPPKYEAPKNIAFVSADAYEYLTREKYEDGDKFAMAGKLFQELLADGTIRKLDKVPANYLDAAQRIAQETAKAEEAKQAAADSDAKANALKNENEILKAKILELGGKV
jgi:hypothetical protein